MSASLLKCGTFKGISPDGQGYRAGAINFGKGRRINVINQGQLQTGADLVVDVDVVLTKMSSNADYSSLTRSLGSLVHISKRRVNVPKVGMCGVDVTTQVHFFSGLSRPDHNVAYCVTP